MLPPKTECERLHPVLQASDVQAAVEFYTKKLGFELGFLWGDPATYAGVNLGKVQIFLQQDAPSPNGVEVYFVVGNADDLHEYQSSQSVKMLCAPEDRPYGLRDYSVEDLNGYRLTFGHYAYNAGPRVKIERVDVPLRLEKRLAALMQDLAERKHMSLTSCFEEILLHTCERLGDGVASPHTVSDLAYIQKLKEKHGIDYDCHASYRFTEE